MSASFSPSIGRRSGASRIGFLVFAITAMSGCRNSCQELCHTMADFAEDTCNKEWTSDDLSACRDKFDDVSEDDEAVCEDIADGLAEEWTCDEINPYFDKDSGGDDGSDDGAEDESTTEG